MKIEKTNAARLLDKAQIPYELISYAVDESDLAAIHETCLDFERIYVSAGQRGLQLYLAPGDLITTVGASVEFLVASE